MMYNTLEKAIYLKSRHELVGLLQDILGITGCVNTAFSTVIAHHCEQYIDICFPYIPYSEERLALFSYLYRQRNNIKPAMQHALASDNRAAIWLALRYSYMGDFTTNGSNTITHCAFYEANLWGLFLEPDGVSDGDIEAVLSFFNTIFTAGQTRWEYMLSHSCCSAIASNAYCHPLCLWKELKPVTDYMGRITIAGYKDWERLVLNDFSCKSLFLRGSKE